VRIEAFEFMPFASRAGATVIGLRFAYDRALVDELKATLRPLHAEVRDPERHIGGAGGWLAEGRCWFVERDAWDVVFVRLVYDGHHVIDWVERPPGVPHYPAPAFAPEPPPAPAPAPPPPAHSVADCLRVVAAAYPHHYALGIWPGAPEPLVTAAYRACAQLFHPDRRGPEGHARMIAVNQAYAVLRDRPPRGPP